QPLLPKSAVCRLLAELVRSYAPCARMVADHVYAAGQTELMSALGFILDHLLPHASEAVSSCRAGVAVLAHRDSRSANGNSQRNPECGSSAQGTQMHRFSLNWGCTSPANRVVVLGFCVTHRASMGNKFETSTASMFSWRSGSIGKDLNPSQTPTQHSQSIRPCHLVGLSEETSSGGDNCVSPYMNNMVRVLLRRGLVTDLARIPHSLDLSSPHMAATVNSALKPLETLSRIVNLPAQGAPGTPRGAGRKGAGQGAGSQGDEEDPRDGRENGGPPELERESSVRVSAGLIFVDLESLQHSVILCSTDELLRKERVKFYVVVPCLTVEEAHQETTDSESNSDSGRSEEDEGEQDEENEDDVDEAEEDDDEDEEVRTVILSKTEAPFALWRGAACGAVLFGASYTAYRFHGLGVCSRDRVVACLSKVRRSIDKLVGVFHAGTSIMFGGSEGIRTYQLPIVPDESNNGAETSSPSIPPPPGTVASTHPLLVRHGDPQGGGPSSRLHRRPRGYRAQGTAHGAGPGGSGTWHVYANRHPNPPAILQRWVSPLQWARFEKKSSSAAANPNLGRGGAATLSSPIARVSSAVLTSSLRSSVSHWACDVTQFLRHMLTGGCPSSQQDQATFVSSGGTGTLANIPTALVRWTEESRVLDGDSMHDCVAGLKPAILEVLEKHRDEELAERREKRRKLQESQPAASENTKEDNNHNQSEEQERSNAVAAASAVGSSLVAASAIATAVTAGVATAAAGALRNTNPPPADMVLPTYPLAPGSTGDSTNAALTTGTAAAATSQIAESAFSLEPSESALCSISSDACGASPARAPAVSSARRPAPWTPRSPPPPPSRLAARAALPPPPAALPSRTSKVTQQFAAWQFVGLRLTGEWIAEDSSLREFDYLSEYLLSWLSRSICRDTGVPVPAQPPQQRAGESAGPSASNDYSSILGDVEIPEGVDPSFLAALPENIRQEVIAEQLRLQRLRTRAQQQQQAAAAASADGAATFTEVNPEFLAALPPSIQEEVLAQQRAEQQRLAAQNCNPDVPVDPASFIQTLPPGLRQQVLADMDDSLLALLPTDLASEAHSLRRELEARHRQMQERFFSSHGGTALSRILRSAAGRMGTRYTIHTVPHHRGQWTWNALSSRGGGGGSSGGATALGGGGGQGASQGARGRQLLDHEALACLLVLLFVDEPRLNTGRLHRVLRNLCYHPPTRHWVVKSLLSILEKTKENKPLEGNSQAVADPPHHRGKKWSKTHVGSSSEGSRGGQGGPQQGGAMQQGGQQPSWLSISLDAALGCRTNVFQVVRHCSTRRPCPQVSIHPQASPVVCRRVPPSRDTLISLAKSFPVHFLPEKVRGGGAGSSATAKGMCRGGGGVKSVATSSSVTAASSSSPVAAEPGRDGDFWSVLVRLDCNTTSGNVGKRAPKAPPDDEGGASSFEASPLAQLISLLAHPVVKRSSLLTDRLLRLLALVSMAIPDQGKENTPPTAAAAAAAAAALPAPVTANGGSASLDLDGALLGRATEVPSCSRQESASRLIGYLAVGTFLAVSACLAASTSTAAPAAEKASKPPEVPIEEETPEVESVVLEQHLKLAVETLTSKACSEEGLEDATSLLLRLSRGCPSARQVVLRLLLEGARDLGATVGASIGALLAELSTLNARLASERLALEENERDDAAGRLPSPSPGSRVAAGTIQDRFTHSTVVITAPGAPLPAGAGRELQLPSMAALTSKMSSQAFFLRVLKVVIQLREAAQSHYQARRRRLSGACELPTASAEPLALSTSTGSMASTPRLENAPCAVQSNANPMDVDGAGSLPPDTADEPPPLSEELRLDALWSTLSDCLLELAETQDQHAVLVLQPAVEAFFLVHASVPPGSTSVPGISGSSREAARRREYRSESRETQLAHIHQEMAPLSPLPLQDNQNAQASGGAAGGAQGSEFLQPDVQKFLGFAETHRTVLNQILRQSSTPLADGPFAVLVDHTRVLDFDVKRRYFRHELERLDEGSRREDLAVHVRREHVFEDSFRELHRRPPEEWKNRFYIVFEGEEGQDAGGLLREWYTIISREIFNPMYALFTTSPGDRVTYMINPASHCNSNHLSYFKFVGRVIAKAVYDNKLLECYFTRSFYKHILGKPVKYTDMESEDYSFYQGLVFLLEHGVRALGYELTFSVEVQEFGVTEVRDLKPGGRHLPVTEETTQEYVRLVCQEKMTGAIRRQLNAFLEGFYEIIPKRLIAIFNEQELELLISGLPSIDVDDLRAHTEYHKYQPNSLQIQWFWRALRSLDQADRAKFLQFVTGTSKV
ncbi:unnamed protein product, partial [Ixodes persulcatus]